MANLSAVQVRNAKSKEKPYKLSDGHGLFFHVAKSGMKIWRYRYKIAGKESTYTLGEYPIMTVEKARIARIEARELVKKGLNPAQVRKEKKSKIIQKK